MTELGGNTHPPTHPHTHAHCQTDCKMLGPVFWNTHNYSFLCLRRTIITHHVDCALGRCLLGVERKRKKKGRNRFNNRAQIDIHWERKTRREREWKKDGVVKIDLIIQRGEKEKQQSRGREGGTAHFNHLSQIVRIFIDVLHLSGVVRQRLLDTYRNEHRHTGVSHHITPNPLWFALSIILCQGELTAFRFLMDRLRGEKTNAGPYFGGWRNSPVSIATPQQLRRSWVSEIGAMRRRKHKRMLKHLLLGGVWERQKKKS